ncbi:hypothetical protein D3C85_1155890 [compost metagenome]
MPITSSWSPGRPRALKKADRRLALPAWISAIAGRPVLLTRCSAASTLPCEARSSCAGSALLFSGYCCSTGKCSGRGCALLSRPSWYSRRITVCCRSYSSRCDGVMRRAVATKSNSVLSERMNGA